LANAEIVALDSVAVGLHWPPGKFCAAASLYTGATRHVLRLRHGLREYFPAALEAFEDLDAADTFMRAGADALHLRPARAMP
jgi:hypothetical protein